MTTTSDQSEAARTEALQRTIETNSGMPAPNMAKGGRSLDEETERFIQSAHEAAQPKR